MSIGHIVFTTGIILSVRLHFTIEIDYINKKILFMQACGCSYLLMQLKDSLLVVFLQALIQL